MLGDKPAMVSSVLLDVVRRQAMIARPQTRKNKDRFAGSFFFGLLGLELIALTTPLPGMMLKVMSLVGARLHQVLIP
jgi:hypothetical protein